MLAIMILGTIGFMLGTGGRSINVDDINRVTGYDPENQGDGTVVFKGEWYEYGNVVTYTASGATATKGQTYTGNLNNNRYEHPDGRTIGSNGVTSITETSTYYYYYPHSLTTSNSTSGECKGISTTSLAYEMIFDRTDYWLASSCIRTGSNYSYFYMRYVNYNGYVYYKSLWDSNVDTYSPSCAVRAVVSL